MLILVIQFISKLLKTKTNSQYLIGYLDKAIGPLLLTLAKMSGYVKIFNVEDRINKLMFFRIEDEQILESIKLLGLRLKI